MARHEKEQVRHSSKGMGATVATFFLSLLATAARGDEPEGTWETAAASSSQVWSLSVGAGVGAMPRYEGDDRYRFRLVPLASLSYRGIATLGPDGLGVTVFHADGFSVTPTLGYGGGRKESADGDLKGLGTIQSAVTAGVVFKYQAGPLSFTVTPRQAVIQSHDGFTTAMSAAYAWQLMPALRLSVGPELTFADGRYEQTYFGVDAVQSARSGKRIYTPGGGVKDVGLGGTLTYALNEHWTMLTHVADRELVGDAADSPIVRAKNDASIVTGVSYRF